MTQLLELEESDRVLEIGTGSGYQAAVLAEIVDEVYTIEIIEELSERAQEILKELDYDNIHYKVGDGFIGWEENAPFDGIIVTCAPDEIPQPLIDQLADDGRMVIPVGEYLPQDLEVVEKKDGEVSIKSITSVSFVPMTGISEEE
jgi:protein-L-isoaspartate(D-aspartate) O-methyltransferase